MNGAPCCVSVYGIIDGVFVKSIQFVINASVKSRHTIPDFCGEHDITPGSSRGLVLHPLVLVTRPALSPYIPYDNFGYPLKIVRVWHDRCKTTPGLVLGGFSCWLYSFTASSR